MYEIYLNSANTEMVVENNQTNVVKPLVDMDISFINRADKTINQQYPKAYEALAQKHGASENVAFARVRHFFACNFSIKDGNPDIDEDWNFNLEIVPCPLRSIGLCEDEICNPQITHEFTHRETEILILFAKGFDEKEIADALFIAKSTVHNHIQNMYKKIGVVGKTSPDRKLVNYAYTKKVI